MQVWNVLHVVRWKYRTQGIAKNSPSGLHHTTLLGCPYNMVNFGPLAAEVVSLVWGTPTNFNGFIILAALLCGTLVVDVSKTAVLNRGYHLYSSGRPSRWALADILVMAALRSRCGQYIFALWFLSIFFIPRLISAAAYWMSTILLHMVWP